MFLSKLLKTLIVSRLSGYGWGSKRCLWLFCLSHPIFAVKLGKLVRILCDRFTVVRLHVRKKIDSLPFVCHNTKYCLAFLRFVNNVLTRYMKEVKRDLS